MNLPAARSWPAPPLRLCKQELCAILSFPVGPASETGMRITSFLVVALLLAACANTTEKPGNGGDVEGFERDGILHNAQTAEDFIVRKLSYSAGLVNYVDPRRAKLTTREVSGESIVFRLDNAGDTGEFHKAALERAAELAVRLAWPDVMIEQEQDREGHLAYVRIETVGTPTDASLGATLPVRIVCMGNAVDIRGGYLYPTPIKNREGRTVALWEGGYLPAAGELPGQRDGKPVKKPLMDARTGQQALDPETGAPLWEEALERRQNLGRVSYILREGVRIVTAVPANELSAEFIELPLDRIIDPYEGAYVLPVSAEMIPMLMDGIERGMAAKGLPCKVDAEGVQRLIVTPLGVREKTLQQIFDELQTVDITFEPKTHCIVVFDEERKRVVIYGPLARRFLVGDVLLGTDPFTVGRDPVTGKSRVPQQLQFRVSVRLLERAVPGRGGKYGVPGPEDQKTGITPPGSKGKVNISWSYSGRSGGLINEGEEVLNSADMADVLRHLWLRGMGPREVLAFCVVAKESSAVIAELGFNPKRVKVDDK